MYRQTSSLVERKQFGSSRSGVVSAEHPPSPPDTESLSSLYATPQRRPSHPDNYMLPTIPATPETWESARVRRLAGPSSQSFSRDFRGASRPQTRWLVVLMPPENLIAELSVGYKSAGKLSSGLLVPLFPTLFAQLAAIAKEFSLPSTTGLCLYLHLPDAPESPRITDEVWPLLWARHLHTDDASLPLGLPVAGRVQFDIDIPSARWYPMWYAHVSRKELVPDLARAMPTSPKPLSSPLGDSNRTRGVHVPRPLALVPRQEPVLQVQIDSGPSPVPSPTPKSASNETVEKVRRWSALVTPEPAALQPEAPAIPTDDSAPLPTETTAVEDAEPEPLNFDDFQWSVTSAGPPSPASSCATTASSRVPSIHILERAEGSVALTPTTATSWGPQYDSDVESELELEPEWGVRSPDVGERAEGSVLLTPSTATSWGAPLSYPPTPAQWAAMHELVRSPDLGERAEGSVLLTPSTATTWGAPLSYPPTPAQWHALYDHIVHSPDLGRRAEGSVLLTPSTATSWGPPLSYPPTPAGARPREWVPSPGLGDREEMSPGRVGRMSTMQWGTEVETEEEAYARMGLPYRWEFGWPTASPLPLPGVQEEEEEVEAGSIRIELVHDATPVARSVSAAVHEEASVQSRAVYEEQYGRDMPFSEDEDDAESLYDGAFGGDEEREELQGSAFEFELELESPHVVQITEERSLAFEDGRGQELADALGQEAEVSFSHEMDDSYREPFEYAPEDVGEASEDYVSEASEDHASEASIEAGVFEYSFPESAAQPSFPVSVSASDDAINFPDLDHIAQPESPMMLSRSVELPVHIEVTSAPVAAPTLAPVRSYGAYPYLVIYPSTYPHLDLYPSVPASRLQTRARLTVNTHARAAASVAAQVESIPTSSPVESVRSRSRSPPSSRKSSLSITVPMSRARSRSILAVNPADKRSARWSGPLPPVPPVPRAIREGSVGSISSLRSVREESVKSVREESVERVQEEDTGAQPQSEQLRERRPSIVHDGAEFELSVPSKKPSSQALPTAYPYRYPDNLGQLYPSKEALSYPTNLARIYPAVRPAQAPLSGGTKTTRLEKSLAVSSNARYPAFNLYPAVYPYNLESIYPSVSRSVVSSKASVVSASAPAPLAVARALAPSASVPPPVPKSQHVAVSRGYPFIDLYPAVYPYNLERIYPSVTPRSFVVPARAPAPVIAARSPIPSAPVPPSKPQYVTMSKGYPLIELYPAVYPHNLESIYPSVSLGSNVAPSSVPAPLAVVRVPTQSAPAPAPASKPQHVMSRGYPFIELYPAVYPYNLERIYPSVSSKSFVAPASIPTPVIAARSPAPSVPVPASKPQYVAMSRGYPFIELYPAVYPHNLENIYPQVSSKSSVPLASVPVPVVATHSSISSVPAPAAKLQRVAMSRGYPFIDLYPAVYPYNLECLYPSVSKAVATPAPAFKRAQLETPVSSNAAASSLGYPFNLYNLYPSVSSAPEPARVATQARKVALSAVKPRSRAKSLSVRLSPTYPNIELYAPVYPFNLVIYPSVVVSNKAQVSRVGEDAADSLVEMPKLEASVFPARTRKTHAQLHTETWRKTHAQLVVEALEEATPARKRTPKSHIELQTEVFPNGLPEAEASPASPEVMITPVETIEAVPEVEAAPRPEVAPALEPTRVPAPVPAVAALRRQRSGTIMRPPPSGPLPTPSSAPQAVDLGRSRSLLERTKMFERAPARSQTGGPQGPPRTLVRQKSATFERAKSLFHTPEEDYAQSEGSRTPPRPTRRVSKLDMSKFGFA